MEFKQELKTYQEIINTELKKYIVRKDCPEKRLNESVEYSLLAGGKRIRPILMLATYQLWKKDTQIVMPYAVALEMIHNFSLIHDDLPGIDNDDIRHGKPTNHKRFNEATAILAGDRLLNQAYQLMSQEIQKYIGDELQKRLRILEEFTNAVDQMIIGEFVDTEYEGKEIAETDLEYIHQNKTGAFIKLSVRVGAILANATKEELENLSQYADRIGLAFQIKDDILSEEGTEEVLGKPVGNDKEKKKSTYVSQYGIQGAKEKLDQITKEAIAYLQEYGTQAKFLKELAWYIQNREK